MRARQRDSRQLRMIPGPRVVPGWKSLSTAILLLVVFAVAPVAHAADAERIIVSDTHLIGRAAAWVTCDPVPEVVVTAITGRDGPPFFADQEGIDGFAVRFLSFAQDGAVRLHDNLENRTAGLDAEPGVWQDMRPDSKNGPKRERTDDIKLEFE